MTLTRGMARCISSWLFLGLFLIAACSLWVPSALAADDTEIRMDVARLDVGIPFIDDVYMWFGDDDGGGGVELPGADSVNDVIREQALAMVTELANIGGVWGEYEVHTARVDLISTTMQYAGYGNYMAHPAHLRASVTADPTTGQVYALADLFEDDTYIERLSAEVARQIEEQAVPAFEPFALIAPNQDFYVTDCALVIYFQVYEIAPYVSGFPEFVIPYHVFEDLVSVHGAKLCRL